MPTWVAWNSSANLPDKANPDSFVPFSANGEMKGAIAEQVLPNEQESEEQESIVRAIIEATHGQLDTRLGYSSNVVMVAGFVDSMAIVNGNEYRKDHLGVLLRQHEDPAKSIPLQLYSRNLASHTSSITIGMPAKVIGELRQKVVPNENGEGIKEMYMYLRCAELVHAQRGQDIKEEPVWLRSILERILSEKMEAETRRRLRREAAAVPQAAEIVMPD
jgi:hypothetical protein